MPTTITSSIGSGGGRDYSTLASWEAAKPANLVTSDQIWRGECYNDSEFTSGSNILTISGSTTDSTRYTELTCATGQSFSDNASAQTNSLKYNSANGVAITSSAGYDSTVTIGEAYCRISKLQFKNTSSSGEVMIFGSAENQWLDKCILEGSPSSPARVALCNANNKFTNTLFICNRASNGLIVRTVTSSLFVNCTFIVPSDVAAATQAFIFDYSSGNVIKNCAVFGCTNISNTNTGTTYTTNYTDVTSPPSGWTNTAYSTSSGAKFQGTTSAAKDYRIQSGSSLLDVGTTDSTNAPLDIVETSRPQGSSYDVGVWELVSGGGGTIYTITPSGGVAFSGSSSLLRTHVQPVSGSIAFSGTAALLRTRVQAPSGGITFSGTQPLLRTRAQIPSGSVVFSGTAPITFVPAAGGTTYTITPSGGIAFSGSASFARTHVQTVSGGLSFSGAVPLIRTRVMVPAGSITFGGTVPQIRTHVIVPSGQIVFSGSAGIVFIPAGSVTAVNLNRISMGLDRAHRLS